MTLDDELDKELFALGKALAPEVSIVANVMRLTMDRPATGNMRIPSPARTINWGFWKLAIISAAAAVIMLMAGSFLLDRHSSRAFADQAVAALAKAQADGVTFQERNIALLADGSKQSSSTHSVVTVGRESYRRDIYEGERLHEVQWYTPHPDQLMEDGPLKLQIQNIDGMNQTSVQFDTKTYSLQRHKGRLDGDHPVDRISSIVKHVDKAERQLEPITIKGRQCPGFQIRANQYGTNPSDWIDRVWFDPETKLPVRIEHERPSTENRIKAIVTVQEEFDWHPSLPDDVYTPKIPEGFTLQ